MYVSVVSTLAHMYIYQERNYIPGRLLAKLAINNRDFLQYFDQASPLNTIIFPSTFCRSFHSLLITANTSICYPTWCWSITHTKNPKTINTLNQEFQKLLSTLIMHYLHVYGSCFYLPDNSTPVQLRSVNPEQVKPENEVFPSSIFINISLYSDEIYSQCYSLSFLM